MFFPTGHRVLKIGITKGLYCCCSRTLSKRSCRLQNVETSGYKQRAVSGGCRSDNKTRACQAKTLKHGLSLLARGYQKRDTAGTGSQRKCKIVTGEGIVVGGTIKGIGCWRECGRSNR